MTKAFKFFTRYIPNGSSSAKDEILEALDDEACVWMQKILEERGTPNLYPQDVFKVEFITSSCFAGVHVTIALTL